MVHEQCRIHPREWDIKFSGGFETTTDPQILARRPDVVIVKKRWSAEKWTLPSVPTSVRKIEENEKHKYLYRRTKKLGNIKVTVLPIVISELGIITKGLIQELEDLEINGWVGTIQTTALLWSASIQRRILEIWGDLPSLKLQWKPIS